MVSAWSLPLAYNVAVELLFPAELNLLRFDLVEDLHCLLSLWVYRLRLVRIRRISREHGQPNSDIQEVLPA
jgi:hypothetical protein